MGKKFKYQEDMDIIKNEHNCDCPNKDLKQPGKLLPKKYLYQVYFVVN